MVEPEHRKCLNRLFGLVDFRATVYNQFSSINNFELKSIKSKVTMTMASAFARVYCEHTTLSGCLVINSNMYCYVNPVQFLRKWFYILSIHVLVGSFGSFALFFSGMCWKGNIDDEFIGMCKAGIYIVLYNCITRMLSINEIFVW